jgi:hypothetical protein
MASDRHTCAGQGALAVGRIRHRRPTSPCRQTPGTRRRPGHPRSRRPTGPDAEGVVLSSRVVTRLHEEVYQRLPHRLLVILGTRGAGKTAAMILLMLAALDHRSRLSGEQRRHTHVPVWLTLGGWDPASTPCACGRGRPLTVTIPTCGPPSKAQTPPGTDCAPGAWRCSSTASTRCPRTPGGGRWTASGTRRPGLGW